MAEKTPRHIIKSKLDAFEHRDVLLSWIQTGVNVTQIMRRLKDDYGFAVSCPTIRRFIDNLNVGDVLPARYADKVKGELYIRIDEVKWMEELALRQRDRLESALETEKESGGVLHRNNDMAISEYRKTLESLLQIKQSLGMIHSEPQKLDVRGMVLSGNVGMSIPQEVFDLSNTDLMAALDGEIRKILGRQSQ